MQNKRYSPLKNCSFHFRLPLLEVNTRVHGQVIHLFRALIKRELAFSILPQFQAGVTELDEAYGFYSCTFHDWM